MFYSSTVAQKQLDYGFLLLTHIVCVDRQIHSEESKYLKELADRANISQSTKDEMKKILARDKHHLTIDCILKRIKIEQRSLVMEQILNTFYKEGLFGLSESEAIARIANMCSWSQKGIKRIVKARNYKAASNYKISLAASSLSENVINYGFLLLAHIVCADRQIHSEESKYLKELGDRANISQSTKDEMQKVLAQDEHHLTIDYIAKQVSVEQQSEVMQQILAIAYADGYFAPLERDLVEHIANIWNWSNTEVDRIITEAELSSNRTNNNDSNNTDLSFAARLLKNGKKSSLSRALIGMVTKAAPETVGRKIEKLEREILLSGPEYDEAIQQCANIAKEDYQYAELAFNETEATLNTLIFSLEKVISKIDNKNSKATTAKEIGKQLKASKQSLDAEIIKKLANVRESHQAKQRALNQFSIAFMGRTKAGKSTLHSIITQDGWESIGVGKQRTTRFNRIYEWKNIRIIDTPGVAAAAEGGRDDEQVAKSIVDEADVICYVVTNDSIQETEFQFLKLLKEKAKPLIVLLNIKYNLRDSRRLEHFLKKPDKLFALEGKNGIGGHIDRIRRYAEEHYANNYFGIVPVMLLAAQLSSEPEH